MGKQTMEWLRMHASTFAGEVYTQDSSRTGYLPEPWRGATFPARPFLKAYPVSSSDFSSFLGSEQAGSVNIINHYVAGVDDGVR